MTVPDADVIAYQTFEPDETFYLEQWREMPAEDRRAIAHSRADFDAWMYRQFDDSSAYEFEALLEWIKDTAQELWPSFEEADSWIDRECHVIAQNAHSVIAVAEYCGMVSINLAARYDRDGYWADPSETAVLGAHWRKQIADRFKKTFGEYSKIGTFSNGESFYTKGV